MEKLTKSTSQDGPGRLQLIWWPKVQVHVVLVGSRNKFKRDFYKQKIARFTIKLE